MFNSTRIDKKILDPHREYYRPDIFSFSGDPIFFELSKSKFRKICKVIWAMGASSSVQNKINYQWESNLTTNS